MLKNSIAVIVNRQPTETKSQDSPPLAVVGALGTSIRLAGRAAVLSLLYMGVVLPSAAQQAGTAPTHPDSNPFSADAVRQQAPMVIAAGINVRRSGLYQRQDTASIAPLYTTEATYIELMPVLQVFKGRDQIKGHLDELISASATGLVPTVREAERSPDGTILVTGDYLILSRGASESVGHFYQTLRWEDGAWRIATHIFARPDPLTSDERFPRD